MEENLNAKISFSFLSIYEKNVTCKRDPEAQDRDETEAFDFQSETRPRPRRSHISPRPRRERDVGKMRLETVSRPRRRDWDYIPAFNNNCTMFTDVWASKTQWTILDC